MDMMHLRRGLLARTAGRLPSEYQEVEYLESTGAQWIKTDIEGRFSASLESEVIFTDSQDSYSVGFKDGTFQLSGNGCYRVRTQIGYGSSYSNGPTQSLRLLKRYKYKTIFEPGKQEVYLDDVLVSTSALAKNVDTLTGVHFGIFARLNNDTSASLFSKVKMYYLKISDGDELLGHFIPCYRKSDSKPGMYDTVAKTFYTNAGTGEFLVGADV